MSDSQTSYPDVSDILARKAEGRTELSRLTFGEKIARMEALRARLEPIKSVRRHRARDGTSPSTELRPKESDARAD